MIPASANDITLRPFSQGLYKVNINFCIIFVIERASCDALQGAQIIQHVYSTFDCLDALDIFSSHQGLQALGDDRDVETSSQVDSLDPDPFLPSGFDVGEDKRFIRCKRFVPLKHKKGHNVGMKGICYLAALACLTTRQQTRPFLVISLKSPSFMSRDVHSCSKPTSRLGIVPISSSSFWSNVSFSGRLAQVAYKAFLSSTMDDEEITSFLGVFEPLLRF